MEISTNLSQSEPIPERATQISKGYHRLIGDDLSESVRKEVRKEVKKRSNMVQNDPKMTLKEV